MTLTYVLSVLSVLVYSVHKIPQISSLQKTPPENLSPPWPKTTSTSRISGSYALKGHLPQKQRANSLGELQSRSSPTNYPTEFCNRTSSGNSTYPQDRNLTTAYKDSNNNEIWKQFHLDHDQYADLDPEYVVVHYRWNLAWIHTAGGQLVTPVLPGIDISQRCTLYSLGPIFTNNQNDCRGMVSVKPDSQSDFIGFFDYSSGYLLFAIFDDRCREEWNRIKRDEVPGTQKLLNGRYVRPQPVPDDYGDNYGCWRDKWETKTTFLYPPRVLAWPEVRGNSAAPVATGIVVTTLTTTIMGPDGNVRASTITTTYASTGAVNGPTRTPVIGNTIGGEILTITDTLG